jgi:HSP20 family protein
MHQAECRYGMFERMVQLPGGIDVDKAKATFKKGVLKVVLPKTPEAQSNRRRIQIQS